MIDLKRRTDQIVQDYRADSTGTRVIVEPSSADIQRFTVTNGEASIEIVLDYANDEVRLNNVPVSRPNGAFLVSVLEQALGYTLGFRAKIEGETLHVRSPARPL